MIQSVFQSPAHVAQFQDDVLEMLNSSYMRGDSTVIQGQSLSFLQQLLRDPHRASGGRRKWVLGGGYCGFTSALKEAGFKVIRARTMRYTRKGEFKPYQPCDVVTL